MFTSRLLRVVLFALVGVASNARAQTYQGRELTDVQLVANTSAIVPGKPFKVGLLLRTVPGWHTYWKFPGDAGIPTETKWHLPSEWKIGDVQWPIPLKIDEPGDILIFGYHDEVLLVQEVTPPAAITDASVKLSAEASWLVCEKICVPGSKSLALEMPVAQNAAPANEELFAKYERELPQPWPNEPTASATWSRDGDALVLQVKTAALAAQSSVDFFPLPPNDSTVVGHVTAQREAGGASFRIPLEGDDAKIASVPGIIVFGANADAADRNAWQLTNATAPTATAARSLPTRDTRGLATFLLFGFIGGFILNLMPCVLPVISLKIFGFIQQAGKSRAKIFRSGLAFSAGIFAWFVGLAFVIIALKAAGHQVAWALQFTNPLFVIAMSAVVLVFALNLFDVFEITLPGAASTEIATWASREGDAGSFFHGVFATVLATPCTAPFLGAALGFAFTQSAAIILLMFVAVAAGMSAPYLALSAQPAWLRVLPKPGPWMLHVKHFMGFLMLATVLFLLAVVGAQRGTDAIIWTSCFLLVLSIACWLHGAFNLPTASTLQRTIVLLLVLALVLGSGLYFIGGKVRDAKLEAAAPSENGWRAFTPEALDAELAKGHAVFVDFTAAWCITCKFNESTVLESSAVRDAFNRRSIVKFKADWTNADPAITKMLQQFGRPGVPLYVLYPAGKSAEPVVLPELLTKNLVLEKLDAIAPQVAATNE